MPLLSGAPEARIGRGASPAEYQLLPVVAVLIGSMVPILPIIATAPVMPPFGFLILLAWRMLRREMWPAWVGVLLGLFDDLFSGNPMGTGVLLWTLAFLAVDALDRRWVWRTFRQEWIIAGLLVTLLSLFSAWISASALLQRPWVLLPQIAAAILVFPIIFRTCAALDRFRNRR